MGFWKGISIPIFLVSLILLYASIRQYQTKKDFNVHQTGAVLITGASKGIGHHSVFALAKQGYHVFGTVRNNQSMLDLSKEAKSRNLESYVHPIIMDILFPSQIDQILETITTFTKENDLPLVGIINNAGYMYISPFETITEDKTRDIIGINCIGPLVLTQKFIPLVRQYKSRILFLTGFNGMATRYGQSIYSSGKHCLESAVDSIRQEMYRFGVSVSIILPGCISTSDGPRKNTLDKNVPKEYMELYGKNVLNILEMTEKGLKSCSPPSVVSDAMLLGLREPYPLTRYYVGDTGTIIPYCLWKFLKIVLMDRLYDLVRVWEY